MISGRLRIWLVPLLGLIVLVLSQWMLHPEVALQGKVYSSSDAQAAAAFRTTAQSAVEAGELPLWNPFVFLGMPSYASFAYNPDTYPLERPIRVLRETFGLVPMSWLLVHFLIAGLTTMGWLRWRGQSWAAAIAGGAWVMALPKLAAWGAYGHGTKVGTFAWMPLALWCTEALVRRGGVAWAAGLAIALALQLLRAHPQIAYYTVMAVGVLAAFHLVPMLREPTTRRRALGRGGWLVLAGVLALGAALVLYLPALEYQAHSVRGAASQGGGASFEYATGWSLSWTEIPTLWWSTAVGYGRGAYVGSMPFTDYPNYLGLPLLLLAGLGFALRRGRSEWALLALAVFTTFVALGKHFFLYQVLFDFLPGFNKFRVPVMILIIQELALVVLAARGLDALVEQLRGSAPRWGRVALVFAGAAGLVFVVLGSVGAGALEEVAMQRWSALAAAAARAVPPADAMRAAASLASADALRLGVILLAAAVIAVAVVRRRIPPLAAIALLGLFGWVDLWRVDQALLRPEGRLPQLARDGQRLVAVPSEPMVRDATVLRDYTQDSELGRWLLAQSDRPRVFPLGGFEGDNRLAAQGIVSLGGYHAAKLKVYEDMRARLFDPQRPAFGLANHLGAEWLVTARPLAEPAIEAVRRLGMDLDPQPVLVGENGSIYRNRSVRPRARVVYRHALEVPGQDTTRREPGASVLGRVLTARHLEGQEVILSAEPEVAPRPASRPATVEKTQEGYTTVTFRVDSETPGVLVVADPYYPAWRVTVDGESRRLLRADHALRGVSVPAGVSEVRFEYAAERYRAGRAWSFASTVLILLGLIAGPVLSWRARSRKTADGEM